MGFCLGVADSVPPLPFSLCRVWRGWKRLSSQLTVWACLSCEESVSESHFESVLGFLSQASQPLAGSVRTDDLIRGGVICAGPEGAVEVEGEAHRGKA